LSRYSNKIKSVGLIKCPYYRYLIEKVTSTDVRATNISQSLPHKMAENSWYEEITSLSPICISDHFGGVSSGQSTALILTTKLATNKQNRRKHKNSACA